MRAFGYLRLSRDSDASTSIAKQRESIERFASDRGWELVDWFEDVDVSGRRESRPGLDAMLARLDETDVVVFHRLDRIMRTVVGFAKLLERCRNADVELTSATEQFDTSTAIGRAFVWLLVSVAEIEAENTSIRMKATHEHLLRQNRSLGQARSFGWRHDPDAHTFVQLPDEVSIVRRVVEAFMSGDGLQAIADGLNDGTFVGASIPSTYGGLWTSNAVRRVLSNPMLIGYQQRHGKLATQEPVFEPVIDVDTYRRLQRSLDERTRRRMRYRKGAGELTGIIVCGECGDRMYLRSNNKRWTSYTCTRRRDHTMSISAPFAHDEIARRLFERADPREIGMAEAQMMNGDARPSELHQAAARLEWGIGELRRDFYENQRMSREEFDTHEIEMMERLERIREKLADEDDDQMDAILRIGELGDLRPMWADPDFTASEKRGIFSIALKRVRVVRAPRRGNRNNADRLVTGHDDWRF